jgi:hypothetical protein
MQSEDYHPYVDRFLDHFPSEGDLTLQLLKGHLLVEELLREALSFLLPHPKALEGERGATFNCHQVICLAEALTPVQAGVPAWAWVAAKQLNVLRNDLAHKLVPKALDTRVSSFIRYIREAEPALGPMFDRHDPSRTNELESCLSVLCGLFYGIRENGGRPA